MRFDNAARLYLLSILYGGASATLNCDIHVDGISFDLKPLTGTHKINSTLETPPSTSEFTWLFNPCSPVERNDASTPFSSKCPDGAQICGIQQIKIPGSDPILASIIPVAGDTDGKQSGAKIERLKALDPNGEEGLRISIKGAAWGDAKDGLHGAIDFICAKDSDDADDKFLTYESWDLNTLKLTWKTKHACENAASEPGKGGDDDNKGGDNKDGDDKKNKDDDSNDSASWGWFTWLFILVALGSAVYIIVGAWLNYNRYGWSTDILPHSDIFRDIPFLVGDLIRKIAGTFSSGSSRGGYSAV